MEPLEKLRRTGRALIPAPIFRAGQPVYHFLLALLGALVYRFPARHLTVIGVTGTKGKSSTLEMLNAIFEEAGYKTALASTIRFKVDGDSRPNKEKMTMPGRFFLQRFLRRAVNTECDVVFVECTSEGTKQFRHLFLFLNALVFTNLAPEHIESHGSFAAYRAAKLKILAALGRSRKKDKAAVANVDDPQGERFLKAGGADPVPFSREDAENIKRRGGKSTFTYRGADFTIPLPGAFNVDNALGAIACAEHFGIEPAVAARGLATLSHIPGRAQLIEFPEGAKRLFEVVVDYAHTPESLESIYAAFENCERICVLGATGGGRDKGKRAELGALASAHCREVVLTDEDPYDEDPEAIVYDVAAGIDDTRKLHVVMDRRRAIRHALARAWELSRETGGKKPRIAVLITGKGTDPFIMRSGGGREPWSDANVAREELARLLRAAAQ